VRFVYHRDYAHSLTGVPMDRKRAERILGFLVEEGLVDRADIEVPRRASLRNLLRAHTPDYLEALERKEALLRILGVSVGEEDAERVLELQRLVTGGTIHATRLALSGRSVVVNLGGGLHHAHRDSGQAFCAYNDIAVAVARLRARGHREPILVVDLDLHDGNGTRSIFAQDPTVHTYSIHNEHWGDTRAEEATSIALGAGVTDEVYLGTLLKTLPPVAEAFDPGLVIYLAGADPAADDTLGNWKITAEGLLTRDCFVAALFRRRRRPLPMVVVLAGGYGERAWRYPARFFSWLLTGRAIEPPETEELTLMRFRRLVEDLDPAALTSEPGDFSWRLTDEDLVGIIPGAAKPSRFLRYFSRRGVELVLESVGICDQLRLRGFDHPTVDVAVDHPLGQTLRVWGGPDRRELLIELRVDRSSRVVPGMELVVIEWLLLQNPRAHFGPYRRPLPSQNHPGLGLLKEVFGWLVATSEILELDGIYYVPSSYHVAIQSRRRVCFLEPEHEALIQGLEALFADTALPEASQLVAGGRVVDRATGETLQWRGYPMVLPVSQALKERVSGDQYEARVATVRSRLDLAVAPAAAGDA
jgi:acetoin utilization deacetylase AcuC-like enzyme